MTKIRFSFATIPSPSLYTFCFAKDLFTTNRVHAHNTFLKANVLTELNRRAAEVISCSRQLGLLYRGLCGAPKLPDSTASEKVAKWKALLEYEEGNPLGLEKKLFDERVLFVYETCLVEMYFYPEMWYQIFLLLFLLLFDILFFSSTISALSSFSLSLLIRQTITISILILGINISDSEVDFPLNVANAELPHYRKTFFCIAFMLTHLQKFQMKNMQMQKSLSRKWQKSRKIHCFG